MTSCWSPRPGRARRRTRCTVAAELLARREVAALTVVTPTEHLKHQWAAAARRFGIAIDPSYATHRAGPAPTSPAWPSPTPRSRRIRRCTASAPQSRRTLVVFDEIHHAGDALTWGDAVEEAFDPARAGSR